MVTVRLAYGETGLTVDLDDARTTVIEPVHHKAAPDQTATLLQALRNPVFAGFSGGPKLVAPGLAALDTVLVLHDATRIGDPRATWGVIEGTRCTTTCGPSRRKQA